MMDDDLEITFRFRDTPQAIPSISFSTKHVPRVGEIVTLMGFSIGGDPFEYHGTVEYVTWIYRPGTTAEAIVFLSDGGAR